MHEITTTKYPVVFIHGAFGYGKQRPLWNYSPPYWPEKQLNQLNPNHIIVDVGFVSSDHDRACEIFYQLLSGTVDYGEQHAEACGHSRFGTHFPNGKHEKWGETHPVHLVGHSLGATTAIELYQLLCSDFFGVRTSHKWVRSITCIAGPLTGSTLPYLVGLHHSLPMRRGTIFHIMCIALVVWLKLAHYFPRLNHILALRMPQWEHLSARKLMSVTGPVNTSKDSGMYNTIPATRIRKNAMLQHMDRVHLLSITTSHRTAHVPTREVLSLVIIVLLGISKVPRWWRKVPHWQSIRTAVITALLVSLWSKVKELDVSKLPSMYALMWLMRRRVKSLDMIYDGFEASHWEHNDGAVNIHSMLRPWFPKPQEMTAEISSDQSLPLASTPSLASALSDIPTVQIGTETLLSRNESYISIDEFRKEDGGDTTTMKSSRSFEKGKWYVFRVPSNHLAGTYWDSNAHNLYKSLFTLLASEYEQEDQEMEGEQEGERKMMTTVVKKKDQFNTAPASSG